MVLVPIIAAILVGVLCFVIGAIVLSGISKVKIALFSLAIAVCLGAFFVYKIYKGVHTLPKGAYYLKDKDEQNKNGE